MRKPVFLLVASFPDSLIKFRGPLIEVLIKAGCQVHVAVPGLEAESDIASRLTGLGVTVHDIPLERTGLNPVKDLSALLALRKLVGEIRADYVLG
ncbi:MAG: glycosyltransferase family 1 protein, partial [Alcanivorax sp.]